LTTVSVCNAFVQVAKLLVKRIFKVLGNAGDASALTNSCYRCIAIILRELPSADISDYQLRVPICEIVSHLYIF